MPQLSIISTCYNDSQYAQELYDSIKEKLNTNEYEWLIVNDGSEIEHELVLNSFSEKNNVSVFTIPNSGPAFGRDFGVSKAKSDAIIIVDIDDVINPEVLKNGLSAFYEKKLGLLVCDCIEFYEDETQDRYWKTGPINIERVIYRNQWMISNIFSKQLWKQAGGFKTKVRFPSEDYLFWLKCIAQKPTIGYLNEPIIRYRRKVFGSRNAKKRSFKEKLLLHRALTPHKLSIARSYFSGKKQKQLISLTKGLLGYHEVQTGDVKKGTALFLESIKNHPIKINLFGTILKAYPKRLTNILFKKTE